MRCILNKTVLILFLLLGSCEGIFIPDPIDPRLPKYSDSGNDVAGAFVDGAIWKSIVSHQLFGSINNHPIIHSFLDIDSMTMSFSGKLNDTDATIDFCLSDIEVNTFEDLLKLNNTKILLDGSRSTGRFHLYAPDNTLNYLNGTGQIYFKRVWKEENYTICISGTFGFDATDDQNRTHEITFGRFDYKISEDMVIFTNQYYY